MKAGSIAVWCKAEVGAEAESLQAELHFNLWRFRSRRPFRHMVRRRLPATWTSGVLTPDPHLRFTAFLDVGLLVDATTAASEIHFFFPAPLAGDALVDLGHCFRNDVIATGIFNELAVPSRVATGTLLEFPGLERSIFVHELLADEYTVSAVAGGTQFVINSIAINRAKKASQATTLYFRIRVFLNRSNDGTFVERMRSWEWAFSSGFHQVECVEFRLNEPRILPPSIDRALHDHGSRRFSVRRIDFLLALDVHTDILFAQTPFHKCRRLEPDIWQSYVYPSSIADPRPKPMIIYHWKPTPSGGGPDDFVGFVKTSARRSGPWYLLLFVFVTLLIGGTGSIVATTLINYMGWWR